MGANRAKPWRCFWPAVLLLVVSPLLNAQQGGEVTHELSFPRLNQQYVHVRSQFPVSGESATVRMASWTPGSYLIRDFASNLDRIAFHGKDGVVLSHAKVSKAEWRVELGGTGLLTVEYDVHAGDLNVQTSWVGQEYILINGASVFLYTDETRGLPHRVSLEVPLEMGKALSALARVEAGRAFAARDFDELVDSPVVVTDAVTHRFLDRDYQFALVNVGAGELWDGAKSARDLRAIVAATNRLWGTVPFEREYWFFNFVVEHGGGLEHDHSTVMMTSRWQMREREDYIKWLSLASHEYFHSWNVRRMRPETLAEYDYRGEQYSGALWLAEGITSYYDDLLLSRAQLINPEEYFKRLAVSLHALELTPGRGLISLEQASRDAWIRSYKPDANTVNSTVSYYSKGAVLGFVLDTRLRRETRDRSSLDDVLRLMYSRWGATPYPEHAFLDAVEAVGGNAVRRWLEPLLNTTVSLDVDEALDWYGLGLDRHPANNAAKVAEKSLEAGFGVTWEPESPALVIGSVVHGTSGSAAGLLPGDELLAISGERVTSDNLDDRLQRLGPGTEVELLLTRRGRIITVPLALEESRPDKFEIKAGPDFGDRELRRLESWLGQPLQRTDD